MTSIYSNYKHNYMHIVVFISDACNYNCNFCYNIKPRTNTFINLDQLFQFLQKIYNYNHKKIFLELIGGEPTLHKELLSFSKKIKQYDCIEYFVFTNFSQNIDYYIELLKNRCALSITWHSKHDDIINEKFIKKLSFLDLKYFDSPGIRLRILYEIEHTLQSLKVFDLLFNKYNKYLEFDILSNINDKNFNYSVDQILEFNNRIKKLKKPTNNDYIQNINGKITYLKFNDIVKHPIFNFKNWKCNAGLDCLYIHANGDIYPCESYYFATAANVFNGIIGNIYDCTFKFPTHGILCKCTECAWSWNIFKQTIF